MLEFRPGVDAIDDVAVLARGRPRPLIVDDEFGAAACVFWLPSEELELACQIALVGVGTCAPAVIFFSPAFMSRSPLAQKCMDS
jgi:hypothetical protein